MKTDRIAEYASRIKSGPWTPKPVLTVGISSILIGKSIYEAARGDFDSGDAVAIPIAVLLTALTISINLAASSVSKDKPLIK